MRPDLCEFVGGAVAIGLFAYGVLRISAAW